METIEKTYSESNSCVNNSIISQDVHYGTLVSSISSLQVTVCKNIEVPKETTPEETSTTEPEIIEEQPNEVEAPNITEEEDN